MLVRIVEKAVAEMLFPQFFDRLGAVREDHVVDPLEGIAGHLGIVAHQVEVSLERSHPVLFPELFEILAFRHQRNN